MLYTTKFLNRCKEQSKKLREINKKIKEKSIQVKENTNNLNIRDLHNAFKNKTLSDTKKFQGLTTSYEYHTFRNLDESKQNELTLTNEINNLKQELRKLVNEETYE